MEREEGIKAIIYLQGLANITETSDDAGESWDSMVEGEQKYTIKIYNMMKGKKHG